MNLYRNNRYVVDWFNSELLQYMDFYVETGSKTYVLVEKYNCDILTTSRIYTCPNGSKKILLPPNSWNSPLVVWKMDFDRIRFETNACNMYAFDTFEECMTYVKVLHATRDTVPFFYMKESLEEDHISKLVDVDCDPPEKKRFKRSKIYISWCCRNTYCIDNKILYKTRWL